MTVLNTGPAAAKSAGLALPMLIAMTNFQMMYTFYREEVIRKHTICTLVELVIIVESDYSTFLLNIPVVSIVTFLHPG